MAAILAVAMAVTLPDPALGEATAIAIGGGSRASALASGCDRGLREIAPTPGFIARLVRTPSGRSLGVGAITEGAAVETNLRILTATYDGNSWSFVTTERLDGAGAALTDVTIAAETAWAAGVQFFGNGRSRPLVVRRVGGRWADASLPAASGVATAIAGDRTGDVWVTTAERGDGDAEARLWHWSSGGWHRVALPTIRGVERFSAVDAPAADRTFVAGMTVTSDGIEPVILARHGTTWSRERALVGDDQVVLSAVRSSGHATAEAVGWALAPGRLRPIIIRRTADGSWGPRTIDGPTGTASMLADVSVDGTRAVQAGSTFLSSAASWLPALTSEPGDATWLVVPRNGWFVRAILGDPTGSGWISVSATARSGDHGSVLARMCAAEPATDPLLRRRLARSTARAVAQAYAADARQVDRGPGASIRRADPGAPGVLPGDLRLRDIAAALGLPTTSASYGIDQGDVNGDGLTDLVWSRHGGAPVSIYLGTDSGFVQTPTATGSTDRHRCVAAPLDGDRREDVACVTGAGHGLGISTTELFLDPTDARSQDIGTERGLTDPVGRGRQIVALDADGDGDIDLYIGNQERNDGLPSLDRLLLNDGAAHFTWSPASGLTASFGVAGAVARDLDGDGASDLLVIQDPREPSGRGIHLYRNRGGRFVDIATRSGVRSIGERDVDAGQLDGRSHLDLVQLSAARLRVSVWRDGGYHIRMDRRVQGGHAVALGDVDGDHDLDIYVARGGRGSPSDDLLLLNSGDGSAWRTRLVPHSDEGAPDDVLTLDLDHDGRDEFVVVHGRSHPGPLRVVDAH